MTAPTTTTTTTTTEPTSLLPDRWPWPDLHELRRPDRRTVAVIAAAGVAFDLAIRSGVAGIGGATGITVLAAGLLLTGRIRNPWARAMLALAPVFGAFLVLRSSPWLLPLDLLTAAALLVAGASYAQRGDPLDLSMPEVAARALHALSHGLLAPGFLRRPQHATTTTRRWPAVARGILLVAPVALAVAALLASADPVFASFVRWPRDLDHLVPHLILLGIGAWGAAGLLRMASAAPFEPERRRPLPVLGVTEATTVLGVLDAVFVAFAATQALAAVRGDAYVRRTAGVTYAEYARHGFFQLLAVTVVTLGVLLLLRSTAAATARPVIALAIAAVALDVLVVAVAVRRLHLYEVAYGLTMLRLCSVLFALWIGAVLVLVGARFAGVAADRHWLVPAAAALAAVGLLVVGALNPEAVVVRRNVARFGGTDRLDVPALARDLSDDAVPALADAARELPPAQADAIRAAVCGTPPRPYHGFWAVNASHRSAVAARHRLCA